MNTRFCTHTADGSICNACMGRTTMHELSREQFWAMCDDQKHGDAQWTRREHVWKQIEDERTDLTAKLEAMTQERDRYKQLLLQSCQDNIEDYKVECKPTCDSYGHEHDCPAAHPGLVYDEIRQQLAASEQRAKELEEESRQWEKASLVDLLRERDQLLATVAAQAEEMGRLREPLESMLNDGKARADSIIDCCDPAVKDLCEKIGYGAVMDSAARQWRKKDAVGAFMVGPCIVIVELALTIGKGAT